MAKPFARTFYGSHEWEEVRSYVLRRDKFLCVKCGKPAEEVHHIIHLSSDNIGDVSITLNPENLTSLCRDCHFKQHMNDRYHREYEFDENGMLVRA